MCSSSPRGTTDDVETHSKTRESIQCIDGGRYPRSARVVRTRGAPRGRPGLRGGRLSVRPRPESPGRGLRGLRGSKTAGGGGDGAPEHRGGLERPGPVRQRERQPGLRTARRHPAVHGPLPGSMLQEAAPKASDRTAEVGPRHGRAPPGGGHGVRPVRRPAAGRRDARLLGGGRGVRKPPRSVDGALPIPERTEWERHHEAEGEPIYRMLFEKVREPVGPVAAPEFRDTNPLRTESEAGISPASGGGSRRDDPP